MDVGGGGEVASFFVELAEVGSAFFESGVGRGGCGGRCKDEGCSEGFFEGFDEKVCVGGGRVGD